MKERLIALPKGSFFLFGPRGTGKSTLLKARFSFDHYIDLLLPENFQSYSARPERLIELVGAMGGTRTIVIDEIQRVPSLLSVIHHLIERDKTLCFIMTGSSSRKLKREGVDLLAGRALRCELHPFMGRELGNKFSLNNALHQGLIPLVVTARDPISTLNSYLALYLRDEVKSEGLIRKVDAFSRFLEVVSFSHGQQINFTRIAQECSVSRTAIASYFEILEDLLLCFFLPVFAKRAKRAVVTTQKFYYFDTGVFRAVRPKGPLDNPGEIEGIALEGLVAQHLRSWTSYQNRQLSLFYWRTRAGTEVDFIIYGQDTFYALEVKNTATVRNSDLAGLKAFIDDYPEATALLLYRGKEALKIDKILCLPIEPFLANLHPSQNLISADHV